MLYLIGSKKRNALYLTGFKSTSYKTAELNFFFHKNHEIHLIFSENPKKYFYNNEGNKFQEYFIIVFNKYNWRITTLIIFNVNDIP